MAKKPNEFAGDFGNLDFGSDFDVGDFGAIPTGSDDTAPHPMDGHEYTGDVEADSKAEMGTLHAGLTAEKDRGGLAAYKSAARREASRFRDVTSNEFWCALIFETRSQKEAFLKAMGWTRHGGDKYLDGVAIAKQMGIELPPGGLKFQDEKQDKSMTGLPVIGDSDE